MTDFASGTNSKPYRPAKNTITDPGTPIEKGPLKFFLDNKGYGFITTDKGDLFVHISAFQRASMDVPEKGTILIFQRGISKDKRPLALILHPNAG